MGRNSLGRKIKNTPLIKKIDLSSAQGISARRRSPPIGGERLRGDFPRAEIPVPRKGGNTPPGALGGGIIPPPELQPQMETAHFSLSIAIKELKILEEFEYFFI